MRIKPRKPSERINIERKPSQTPKDVGIKDAKRIPESRKPKQMDSGIKETKTQIPESRKPKQVDSGIKETKTDGFRNQGNQNKWIPESRNQNKRIPESRKPKQMDSGIKETKTNGLRNQGNQTKWV